MDEIKITYEDIVAEFGPDFLEISHKNEEIGLDSRFFERSYQDVFPISNTSSMEDIFERPEEYAEMSAILYGDIDEETWLYSGKYYDSNQDFLYA